VILFVKNQLELEKKQLFIDYMADNQYQLQQYKHVNSTNANISDKVYLQSKNKNMVNYDVISSVNVAEQFETERQNSLSFRIYGGLEYYSILNNIPVSYISLNNFFGKQIINPIVGVKDFFTSVDVYIVKPYTGYTQLTSSKFVKRYQVVIAPSNIDVMNAAFSKNIFFEKKMLFGCSEDIELYDQVDGFGKPITDLYLYFHYKPNGLVNETLTKKTFDASSTETLFIETPLTINSYNVGDIIDGDLITYNKNDFFEKNLNLQEHFIEFRYVENSVTKFLKFKYQPFYKIKVREFGVEQIIQNVTATTIETIIPSYAVQLDDQGNYLWHDLLDFGYVDPLENIGLDFPFVNGSHYVFNNIIFSMQPDMSHTNTANVFTNISFGPNKLINTTPITGLNNAGKIC
jgi:hypothetical protein